MGPKVSKLLRNKPQVTPITRMCSLTIKLFNSQLRLVWARLLGRVADSLRVTWAPHLAAKIPGRAVPEPNSNTLLPESSERFSQRNQASTGADGQV